MRKAFALCTLSLVLMLGACMTTGPDAPSRTNGCIGNECDDAGGSRADGSQGSDGGAPSHDPFQGGTKTASLVKSGFQFTEGPLWIADKLLFSDTTGNTLYVLVGTTSSVYRANSNGANGNALAADGKVVTCETTTHRLVKGATTTPGTVATAADTFNGKKLNSPNDVIVRADGTIYFTDPNYSSVDGTSNQLPFEGAYRIPAAGGAPLRLGGRFTRANGIALSISQTTLYVVDNGANAVLSASVSADGTTGDFTKLVPDTPGGDGMAVDDDDNLYVACSDGIRVFTQAGTSLGTIAVGEQPSNCSFGGVDRRTLFITARTGVYSVVLGVPGLP